MEGSSTPVKRLVTWYYDTTICRSAGAASDPGNWPGDAAGVRSGLGLATWPDHRH